MKKLIKKIPVVRSIAESFYKKWVLSQKPFTNSKAYWIERYDSGGNSGAGSYRQLAQFKADILNEFVRVNNVDSVIEYGCGDGNQLELAEYPSYIGFDVSPKALTLCRKRFMSDETKTFRLIDDYAGDKADLTLSLDVIYHLVEEKVFEDYVNTLFDSAEKFVIIYSSNTDVTIANQASHVKHRKFSAWIEKHKPAWKLRTHIPNKYSFTGDPKTGTLADFFIYEKMSYQPELNQPISS